MAIEICGYTFDGPYTQVDYLRRQGGIYVILDKRADGRWWVIDVGESGDIRERIECHDRATCWRFNQQGTLGVAVLYTPNWAADQRRLLESRIREAYSPACGVR
jgi:hypothetical protein